MRWSAWSVPLVVTAGCGRVAFEPTELQPTADAQAPRICGPFAPPVRVPEVSSVGDDDWSPFISADGLELYVAGNRPGGQGQDVWVHRRASVSVPFGASATVVISSASRDQSPTLTGDGLLLFFESDMPGGLGGNDIWMTSRASSKDAFAPPVHLAEVSSPGDDTQPFITADGLTLYVMSDRPGGKGLRDVWRSARGSRGDPFPAPEPVAELNTAAHERGIAISADGLEAFITSSRPGGVSPGELDLWRTTRTALAEPFGPLENVTVLNSALDDGFASLSADGTTIYFNHDTQTDGSLDTDVWRATRSCSP